MIAHLLLAPALAAEPWVLVAAYESAMLPSGAPTNTMGAATEGASTAYTPEATQMASGQMSALALVLQKPTSDSSVTGRQNVRVLFGDPDPGQEGEAQDQSRALVYLEPAVLGRNLQVSIEDESEPQDPAKANLIRHQIAQMLLLEECTGRAWIGVDAEAEDSSLLLRQALLLDLRPSGSYPGLFFHDDILPVPALLNAGSACESARSGPTQALAADPNSQRNTCPTPGSPRSKAFLSDAWLSPCDGDPGKDVMKLSLKLGESCEAPNEDPCHGDNNQSCVPFNISVSVNGIEHPLGCGALERGVADPELVGQSTAQRRDEPATGAFARKGTQLTDVLAQVPGLYPTLQDPAGEDSYVLLLIPAWQIPAAWLENRRRLTQCTRDCFQCAGECSECTDECTHAPEQALLDDPVHWVLTHPEWLSVVAMDPSSPAEDSGDHAVWRTVASGFSTVPFQARVGDPAGLRGAEAPVISPRLEFVADDAGVHRRGPLVLTLCSAALTLAFGLGGLLRIKELTLGAPVERISWWPAPDDTPQLPVPTAQIASEESGERS